MFLKAVAMIGIGLGVLVVAYGVVTYRSTFSAATDASAVQIIQLATQSSLVVVSGIASILFGFAVGAIAVLREIRNALEPNSEVAE